MKSSWSRVTYQHADRIELKNSSTCLGKMLAHNSATYHPTTSQFSEMELIRSLCGSMQQGYLKDLNDPGTTSVTNRGLQHTAAIAIDADKLVERKCRAQVRADSYNKQVAIDEGKGRRAFAKRTGRPLKRTVFTKNKGRRLTVTKTVTKRPAIKA